MVNGSTIKIGPISYTVIETEGLCDGDQKLDGHIKYGSSEIWLDAELSSQAKRQTLWHEVIHGILTQAGHRDDSVGDGLIDALAYGIVAVLQDNSVLRDMDG